MSSGIHKDGICLFMEKQMPKFVCQNQCALLLGKSFIEIDDMVSLKILIKTTDSASRSIHENHIQSTDNFKRIP